MNTNASGTTGAQLAHDRVDRYRPLGVFGKPAYQSHVQLRAMLKAKRGDKVANYFARPTYDPDLGELRWTAEMPGTARGWHEMSGEEQVQRALDLEVVRSGLVSFAQDLRTQNAGQPGGATSFASLLEQATRVPADGNFLYFVDDQPVIAFWGFEDQNGFSVDPSALAPKSSPAPKGEPVVAAAATTEATPVAAAAATRPAWWKWLLWLLLALLLLALLFFGLRGCKSDEADGSLFGLPSAKPTDPTTATPPGVVPSQPPVDTVAPPGVGGPSSSVPPPVGTVPGIEPPSAPGTTPEIAPPVPGTGPDAVAPPDTKVPPGDAPSESRTEPPVPPVPEPPGTPDTTNPKGSDPTPPAPPSADSGRPMKMPASPTAARKLDFLEGDWKAGEGLVDRKTKEPLDLSFKFSKDGKGEVTFRRPDGTSCSGEVQGRMDGGKLGIRGSDAVPCSDGSRYGAPQIECGNDSGGQTQCFGLNPDGSRYYMGMQRR
ncbi:hypothetical protein [Variovorax sp. JS1663]|uniref:hypothetical protein n=1 Tax=Variovorax sp. JS1663 TaxID=1851577 RepID=UPI000B345281|nr:hypothetical protein [Variovorax sp. JS1663]OUL98852.1 hypothetical protein A8M77_29610 [Variovorax sp. JS1663]